MNDDEFWSDTTSSPLPGPPRRGEGERVFQAGEMLRHRPSQHRRRLRADNHQVPLKLLPQFLN